MGRSKYTYTVLAPIVAEEKSVAGVLRRLGLKQSGGSHRYISSRIRLLGIDVAHFNQEGGGQSWAKGKTAATSERVRRMQQSRRRADSEVFIENSPETNGTRIKKRLEDLGWKMRCSRCGISEWMGEPLTPHLDHINGVNNDNRYENLRLLCPNCHSQTETYSGKKNGRVV